MVSKYVLQIDKQDRVYTLIFSAKERGAQNVVYGEAVHKGLFQDAGKIYRTYLYECCVPARVSMYLPGAVKKSTIILAILILSDSNRINIPTIHRDPTVVLCYLILRTWW